MSNVASTGAGVPPVEVRRAQVWVDSDGVRHVVIGTTKTKQIITYDYGKNQLTKHEPGDLVRLVQDVAAPLGDDRRPMIRVAGLFSWEPQAGYQAVPKNFFGDAGVVELVRMEDAQAAVNAAYAQRDQALAALQTLRESVAQFQAVLDGAMPQKTEGNKA